MKILLAIALGVVSLTGLNGAVTPAFSTDHLTDYLVAQSMPTSANPIANTQWQLTEISGSAVPRNAQIRLQFDNQNRLGGRGGCNHYGAQIQTLGSANADGQIAFTISAISATRMGCSPELMEAENRYFQALQTARSMTIQNSSLQIAAEDGTQLRFTRLNTHEIRTLTFFEGRRNVVRVFVQNGETRMNVYDKRDRRTWIRGLPVETRQTSTGTEYISSQGESRLIVFVPNSGETPTLRINGVVDR